MVGLVLALDLLETLVLVVNLLPLLIWSDRVSADLKQELEFHDSNETC